VTALTMRGQVELRQHSSGSSLVTNITKRCS
jgi:hypothetical protein